MDWRRAVISAGFSLVGTTGLHRVAAPWTRGLGVILTFHHVRPAHHDSFAPNRLLEITPEFLDATIRHLLRKGYAIVTLDEARTRILAGGPDQPPFAVLTFDDGYKDNLVHALPVLERHGVPGTIYVTTGYAERTARLWWLELEEAIRRADRVRVTIGGEALDLDARCPAAKQAAFNAVYWRLRRGPEARLLDIIGVLGRAHGVEPAALVEALCLDWAEVRALAGHPLVTIGAHTVTHPMLAKHDAKRVRRELADGRAILAEKLGRPVDHLSYPVGDPTSAGPREFTIASELGYATGVTTRPGLLFPAHRNRLHALPRVSINGLHQTVRELDVLLSGLALLLWNKGQCVPALEAG